MNSLQVFQNSELGISVRAIKNSDGSISINAEDAAKGFGFTTIATSGNEVVRWNRVNKYLQDIGSYPRVGTEDYIPESLFYMLGMKASNKTALKFQKWLAQDVIPSIRKTGSYILKNVKYIEQLEGVKRIADDLKVNPGSRVLMYKKACEANNVDSSFLPAYTEEKLTKSLTDLLKQFNVEHSARSFNTKLIKAGIVEIATRPSTKAPSGFKNFKRLTDKGLKYGKNLISPSNQRETQPHYYIDTFQELVDKVSKN